jgi:hypothetical protein
MTFWVCWRNRSAQSYVLCFDCSSNIKVQYNYVLDSAMRTHLRHNHDTIVDCIISSQNAEWDLQTGLKMKFISTKTSHLEDSSLTGFLGI